LQTGEFTRVGGERTLRTDCRVVAATNRDLEEMVKAGAFREDLYFRLSVVPIRSPGLVERVDDIPLLVEAFVQECCDENGFGYKPVDEPVLERLKRYAWPGNVRELRNVVERLVIMSDDAIREKDVPSYLGGARTVVRTTASLGTPQTLIDLARYSGKTLREFRDEVEGEFIKLRLAESEWNISSTARALGIERTNLHKKLRTLGIHRGGEGSGGEHDS
jgi:two-component system nitrogen regulation response regulator NtrX